ncbi:hypothetical protein D3C76_1158350 [compost metagenome]
MSPSWFSCRHCPPRPGWTWRCVGKAMTWPRSGPLCLAPPWRITRKMTVPSTTWSSWPASTLSAPSPINGCGSRSLQRWSTTLPRRSATTRSYALGPPPRTTSAWATCPMPKATIQIATAATFWPPPRHSGPPLHSWKVTRWEKSSSSTSMPRPRAVCEPMAPLYRAPSTPGCSQKSVPVTAPATV